MTYDEYCQAWPHIPREDFCEIYEEMYREDRQGARRNARREKWIAKKRAERFEQLADDAKIKRTPVFA